MKNKSLRVVAMLLAASPFLFAQTDWIRTGTGLGVEKVRIAVPDFKAAGTDPQTTTFLQVFNATLWNDLDNAGTLELVSKSFYPLEVPGLPSQLHPDAWADAPANASMVAFGNFGVNGANVAMQGWLYDVKNSGNPMVLGKQYSAATSEENARSLAHKFADDIIYRLGGAIAGVAESRIYFISARTGHKEVWSMDYDGAGQTQLTRQSGIALSPRISPDSSRVVFSIIGPRGLQLMMYSLELGRLSSFPAFKGTNISPAWSANGTRLAFSSSMRGHPNIYVSDSIGGGLRQLTSDLGPDVSPVWNPKTSAQIAFVSGRSGLPQIYVMDADGANLQRMTDTGYAVSPSWSPNGQYLAFAWRRTYGPGAPGNQDIYIMDVTTKQWVQLTHDSGVNDYPSWSPDGRHLAYESKQGGRTQIWSMLADGSKAYVLTISGREEQPNWSWK